MLTASVRALTMQAGKLGLHHTALLTSRTELDLHPNVSVVGHNKLILTNFERLVTVVGYDPTSKPLENVRTVGAALAYDHPETGQTIILTIHEALHIPTLSNNLLCTFSSWNSQLFAYKETDKT